jgi:hypothetical protein
LIPFHSTVMTMKQHLFDRPIRRQESDLRPLNVDADVKAVPLTKTTPSSAAFVFHRRHKWLVPLLLCLFLAASISHFSEAEAIKEGFLAEDVTVKYTSSDGSSGIVSTSSTGKKKKSGLSSTKESQNPLLSFPKMLLAFQQKRQEWFDQLEKDYGKNFTKILLDHGRTAIRPPNEVSAIRPANETVPLYSNNRMRRKMIIKLLEAQEAARHQRSRNLRINVQRNSNSTNTTAKSAKRTRRQADSTCTDTHDFPKFVWASGGHRYAT